MAPRPAKKGETKWCDVHTTSRHDASECKSEHMDKMSRLKDPAAIADGSSLHRTCMVENCGNQTNATGEGIHTPNARQNNRKESDSEQEIHLLTPPSGRAWRELEKKHDYETTVKTR